MKISVIRNKKKYQRTVYIIVFLLILIGIFISEIFWKNPLFRISIDLQNKIHGSKLKIFYEIVHFIGSKYFFFIIISLVFNFANIYKTFILTWIYLFSTLSGSTLKNLYQDPRPYWIIPNINNGICDFSYANPSYHMLTAVAFYLSSWKIIFLSQKLKSKSMLKNFCLILIITFFIFLSFGRLINGQESINQLMFGSLVGFAIYFFVFHVLNLNCNNFKEFTFFMGIKIIYFFILVFLFSVLPLVFYIFIKSQTNKIWIVNSNKSSCFSNPYMPQYGEYIFGSIGEFFGGIGIFIGIHLELKITLRNNINTYIDYNFNSLKNDEVSLLLNANCINKETQWNKTTRLKTICRMLIYLVLIGAILSPFIFIDLNISHENHVKFLIFQFLKNFLLIFSLSITIFFIFKHICRKLKLTNSRTLMIFEEDL